MIFILACGGWLALRYSGMFPCWIVFGRIEDNIGNPIENVQITAYIGIGENSSAQSKTNGYFLVIVAVPRWSVCKGGLPSLYVNKPGYHEYWSYFERWSWGPKFTRVTVRLVKDVKKQ